MMITCREFEDFILDYLRHDLPLRQRLIFDFHLKMCPECRDYLRAYKDTIEVLQRVYERDEAPLPEEVPEDLIEAVLAAKSNSSNGMRD